MIFVLQSCLRTVHNKCHWENEKVFYKESWHLTTPVCPVIRKESNKHTCCLEQVLVGCQLASVLSLILGCRKGKDAPWRTLLHTRLWNQNGFVLQIADLVSGRVSVLSLQKWIFYSKFTPHWLTFGMWPDYQTGFQTLCKEDCQVLSGKMSSTQTCREWKEQLVPEQFLVPGTQECPWTRFQGWNASGIEIG